MRELFIDIETYSDVDLQTSGVQRYVKDKSTQMLLVGYAYGDDPVRVIDLTAGERIPKDLFNNATIYLAHNASFEYAFFHDTALSNWRCVMAQGKIHGLPASLGKLGEALHLSKDALKEKEGKVLINFFSKPIKPTKKNGMRTRNLPHHDPEKWKRFKYYCAQDVIAERANYRELCKRGMVMTAHEQRLWELDIIENENGVKVDTALIRNAWDTFLKYKEYTTARMKELTGLANPNSNIQFKGWLQKNGVFTHSVDKENVALLLEDKNLHPVVREVLELKQAGNKTSVSKYERALQMLIEGRVHDYIEYAGATRTGRYAGRGVQFHNLPSRNKILTTPELIDKARRAVRLGSISSTGQIEGFALNQTPTVLSELIRTIILPDTGKRLAVADYSAIEARVLAWLSGEKWRLDVFNTHEKLYEASASAMFGVPLEKISKGNPEYSLRAKGKVAELALGYQGGKGALVRMGALDMGLTEEELPGIVSRWRKASPKIKDFWYTVQELAITAIKYPGNMYYYEDKLRIWYHRGNLNIMLPSGRIVVYWNARLEPGEYGPKIIMKNVTDKSRTWADSDTYGGKLVENITQAVARDCLAQALINLADAGYDVLFHVHDEVIVQADDDAQLDHIIELMCDLPDWAKGLPINADGFCNSYYRKD